ncbi:SLC13 family permease [Xinfangfangia sp. D13-10-4-6]|nr:SLC13 family permease [Pseudogemmobacter hezensis]
MLAGFVALVQPWGLSSLQAQMLAVILVTLVLWATALVPGYLASLGFFAFVLVLGLTTPDLVFSGFSSAAVWLIVSGFVIGAAIGLTGLGARLAAVLAPLLGGSYPRLIGGLMVTAALMAFVMPSSVGRAAVLAPLGIALADRLGLVPGSQGRIGVAVAVAIGCNIPGFAILPANIPNMVLSGAADTILGIHLGYMQYLILHYPIMGLLKSALAVVLILRLFPASTTEASAPPVVAPAAGDTGAQLRVGLVLLVTLGFWMTDSLHGINAAWIGLVAACALLLPRFGVVPPQAFRQAMDFGLLLFVAGALALGALVNSSGLGAMLGTALADLLPIREGAAFLNFMSLSLMATVTGLFTTVPGVPAVLTPLAPDLAQSSGFGLETVLMTQVLGFSTPLFPYQVAPLIVAMQLSGERPSHLLRIILPLAGLTVVMLLPLEFLWWRLLGQI